MLACVGILLLTLTAPPQEDIPRIEGVEDWDIIVTFDPNTDRTELALTSSGGIIQMTRKGEPTLISATNHNCPRKPLFIRIDDNSGLLLGERGRRNVDFAFSQMLKGKKAVIAHYDLPCESPSYAEVDLAGLSETVEKLKQLSDSEVDRLASSIVEERQRQEVADEEEKKRQNPSGALLDAARAGDLVQVISFLNSGADVDARTEGNGYSSLLWASARGHREVVLALLDAEADVNSQAKDGQTALMRASNNGHLEIVRALVDSGADVNLATEHGVTALKLATIMGHTAIVEILQQAGAKTQ